MENKILHIRFINNLKNIRLKIPIQLFFFILIAVLIFNNCKKEPEYNNWDISTYNGSYKNINYSEILVKEYTSGVYEEAQIPDDILQLSYGRIEIDFRYDGGALNSFMPLFYFGSTNKNDKDNGVEEPEFHLAIEIGHYNVIPFPVEYLFYTISTYRQPQYCRDTYLPVKTGVNYTMILDKKPEGIILQLKELDTIVNIFPHAFFPDSSQMFFKDVTSYIDRNSGDSLKKILMVGKGFAGFDKGIHEFNGQISSLRIIKYNISGSSTGYELFFVRNQHCENQQVNYIIKDNLNENDKNIHMKYEFNPYKFQFGKFVPDGPGQIVESINTKNNSQLTYNIEQKNLGFYKIYLETKDSDGNILNSTEKSFDIWVYPKEWIFEFY